MPSPRLLAAYKKVHGHEWLARSYDFPEMETAMPKHKPRALSDFGKNILAFVTLVAGITAAALWFVSG